MYVTSVEPELCQFHKCSVPEFWRWDVYVTVQLCDGVRDVLWMSECIALNKCAWNWERGSKEGPERSMRFIMCNIFMDVENYAKYETDLCKFGRRSRRRDLTNRPFARQCTEKAVDIHSYPERDSITRFQLFNPFGRLCTLNGMNGVFRAICRVIKRE